MRNYYVYLCGPITGTSYKECTGWREYLETKIENNRKELEAQKVKLCERIITVNPLRCENHLAKKRNIKDHYDDQILGTGKVIKLRDQFDVKRCHVILVNFVGAKKVSIFSVMEIAWAHLLGKNIIITMEDSNIHSHAVLKEMGIIVPTLDQAIYVLESMVYTQKLPIYNPSTKLITEN